MAKSKRKKNTAKKDPDDLLVVGDIMRMLRDKTIDHADAILFALIHQGEGGVYKTTIPRQVTPTNRQGDINGVNYGNKRQGEANAD